MSEDKSRHVGRIPEKHPVSLVCLGLCVVLVPMWLSKFTKITPALIIVY